MIEKIIQGTTPTHTFTLPFDTAIVKTARFVYEQSGEKVFCKDMKDLSLDGMEISATLTQEETYKLKPCFNVELRLRVLTTDGEALVTEQPVLFAVCCIADKEVLA